MKLINLISGILGLFLLTSCYLGEGLGGGLAGVPQTHQINKISRQLLFDYSLFTSYYQLITKQFLVILTD